MKHAQPYASGYSLALGGDLAGHVHADGSLSLERPDGAAVDLLPAQVEALADLLKMSGNVRSMARRRRARAAYSARWGDGEE